MKSLVIAAALVAFVCAFERPANVRDRSDRTEAEIAEKREKWNAMTEEERQEIRGQHEKHFNGIPAEIRQKIHEKFESLSPEDRQKLKEAIKERKANKGQVSDEEKQKFHQKFQAIHARLSALPEEERQQEIQKLRREHGPPPMAMNIPVEIRQSMREMFESLSPEQRQNMMNMHRMRFTDNAFNQAQVLPVAVNHLSGENRPRPERNQPLRQGDFQRIRNVDDDRMIRGDLTAIRRKQE